MVLSLTFCPLLYSAVCWDLGSWHYFLLKDREGTWYPGELWDEEPARMGWKGKECCCQGAEEPVPRAAPPMGAPAAPFPGCLLWVTACHKVCCCRSWKPFCDLFSAACESFLREGWVLRHSSSSLCRRGLLLFYFCQANIGDGFQGNGKAEEGVSLKNHFL